MSDDTPQTGPIMNPTSVPGYGMPADSPGYGPPPGPPCPGPPMGYAAPDHHNAATVLILGILSLVCCGAFTGIPAIVMGHRAMREIDASQGTVGGRGTVKAGFICGIVGTGIFVLTIVFYIGVIGLALLSENTYTGPGTSV